MIAPGDRVLLRDQPLLGPLIVDHVRTFFAGEPESNGPVWAWHDGGRAPACYDQCELVPCPPGYESAPPADKPWVALRWLQRNRPLLVALHGGETIHINRAAHPRTHPAARTNQDRACRRTRGNRDAPGRDRDGRAAQLLRALIERAS